MVRQLYGDSLASSNKEKCNERGAEKGLSLRKLHLQALQLLTRVIERHPRRNPGVPEP
jgi:hypothetical protein